MANAAPSPPDPQASPSDPAADRDAAALPNLTLVLHVVQILLAYGRHLVETFDSRAAAGGFHLIAKHFGTSKPAVILAHIRRGVLRAAALHHVLLQRATTGRDLTLPPYHPHRPRKAPQAAAGQADSPASEPSPRKRNPSPRCSWRDEMLDNAPDPLDPRLLPTFEDLLKEVRRRPIGRTVGDICTDLGIGPRLCHSKFWNDLFFVTLRYNGSPGIYDVRRWRREQQFEQEQDRFPTMDLSWPPLDVGGGRRDILQVMGFLIGEPPVEPPDLLPREDPPWIRRPSPAPAARHAQHTPPAPAAPRGATGPP